MDEENGKVILLNQPNNHSLSKLVKLEEEKQRNLIMKQMKKEAELNQLKREGRQLQKENKYIKLSKTWRFMLLLRIAKKTTDGIRIFFRNRSQGITNADLIEENKKLQKKLSILQLDYDKTYEALKREQLHLYRELDRTAIKSLHNLAKSSKENGEIIAYIDQLTERKAIVETNYREALIKTARLFNKENPDFRQLVYSRLLPAFTLEDIPEFMVRQAESEQTLSLQKTASFRAMLTSRARLRQLRGETPEQKLDHKLHAYHLMDDLGIKRPWVKETYFSHSEIPLEENTVIKPCDGAGSRGVYLVFHPTEIQDVRRSRLLSSRRALEESIREDLDNGWVKSDKWMVEELILKNKTEELPASDLKFYCFYGKVALILEITRFPKINYCWWTADGKRISTGKYEESLYKGHGVEPEELEVVSSISSQLPIPFIRIDFLKRDDALVFGEFTPKPGNYDAFDKKTDQWLGNYYIDADGRLVEDLLNKKQFAAYHSWISRLKKEGY